MTDDNFKSCIQSAPESSLIVLEDIDALFDKNRSKKHEQCPLTFSGLLNGLDGVGNPDGQIFILTTNFVEQLDAALIRSGRVDMHVQFPMATDSQLERIFLLFYPQETTLAQEFVKGIRANFGNGISMAAVQQHFISMMFASPKDVVAAVKELGNRLDVVKQLQESTVVPEEEKKEEKKDEKKDEKEATDKDLASSFKGLDKAILIEQLKKIPEIKPVVIDFFSKQFDRFSTKTEEKPSSTQTNNDKKENADSEKH